MKYTFFLCLFLLSNLANAQQEETNDGLYHLLSFDTRKMELGDVKKGGTVESAFHFVNTSDEEVTIEFISVCECTEVEYPTLPIKPGEKGKIDFVFDSGKKEKNEEITIDILLSNLEPDTGYQVVEQVVYTYNLVD